MLRIKTAMQFVEEMERTDYLQKNCKADGVSVKSVLQNRPVPESHADLVEFFLSTESQEINFEIARYRSRWSSQSAFLRPCLNPKPEKPTQTHSTLILFRRCNIDIIIVHGIIALNNYTKGF
jgi:hypothetical protein